MIIRRLSKDLLLTQAELKCLQLAVTYQRRSFIGALFVLIGPLRRLLLLSRQWPPNPLRAALQLLLLLSLLPLFGVLQCLISALRLLFLPLRLMLTCWLPKGIVAPGEKNLSGMHNAFARHFQLTETAYVDCFDAWIAVLYSERVVAGCSLRAELSRERLRIRESGGDADSSLYLKSFIAQARERLSQKLGHYLAGEASR